jgi:hypothetical protein
MDLKLMLEPKENISKTERLEPHLWVEKTEKLEPHLKKFRILMLDPM